MNKSTRVLVETAIMIAMAFILEVLFTTLPGMPQGGRVSLSMLPIIVLAWRHGVVPGVIAGVSFSVLNMLLDGFSPAGWAITYQAFFGSMVLDYLLAFGLIGLAGLVKPFGDNVYNFVIAILIGSLLRFLMHLLSGVLIWSDYADGQNVWIYSFVYNGTYMLPTTLLLAVVGYFLYFPLKSYDNAQN